MIACGRLTVLPALAWGLLLLLPSSSIRAGEEEPAVPWDEVADKPDLLIPLLGHDSWRVREKATALLDRLGEKALPALEKALKSPDCPHLSRARLPSAPSTT